jgi:hypothetical protein
MSLFENSDYQWRETYFVLFQAAKRPDAENVRRSLQKLDSRYKIDGVQANPKGLLECLTLISLDDYSAMDVSYVDSDDVAEQLPDLLRQLKSTAGKDDADQISKISKCNCRFDVFHFEHLVDGRSESEEDEFLDPGALLIVLQKLATLCDGVVVDPQSNTLL